MDVSNSFNPAKVRAIFTLQKWCLDAFFLFEIVPFQSGANPKMPAKTCPCRMGSFSIWTVKSFFQEKHGMVVEVKSFQHLRFSIQVLGMVVMFLFRRNFGWLSKQTMRPSFGILLRAFRFVRWGTWGQWTQGKDDCWSEIFDMWWSSDTDDDWNPVATKGCIMNVPSQKQTDPLKNRPSQRERGLPTTNFQGLC